MKLKKIICMIVICMTFKYVYGLEYKSGIENFPESYRPYLYALQEKHPNWKFTAMYTGLDWNTALEKESHLSNRLTVSLAPSSWNKAWHYFLANGNTNRVEQGWVTASSNAVRFTMDPRNFINEETIFQFEELTYNKDIHKLEGVEQILYGTEMAKTVTETVDGKTVNKTVIKEIEYYKFVSGEDKLKTTTALYLRESPAASSKSICLMDKGTVVTTVELNAKTDETGIWAKIKLSDGKEGYACRVAADKTEYLIACGSTTTELVKYIDVGDLDHDGSTTDTLTYAEAYMIAAETSGVSPYALALRTKNETGCKISSNGQISGKAQAAPGYYNYYSIGAYGDNPMENGVLYARDNEWDNPVKAIVEGAKFWGSSYILAKQNTPYLQKYNVNTQTPNGLYSHQYMTDITCIYREAFGMYETYSELNIIDKEFTFIIPVYNNMPEEPYNIYTDYEEYFSKETDEIVTNKNTAIYSLIQTSSGVQKVEMLQVPAGTKITRVAIGVVSEYDRVKYMVDGSAMYGYIFFKSYDLTKKEDNTKMEVIASPSVRMRSEPNVSSSQVCILYTGDIVTRIEKNSATNSTGIWDKVVTADGKTGYVCRVYQDGADVYLKELSYVKVESVKFEKESYEVNFSNKLKLNYEVLPNNAQYKEVTFISSDTNIAEVDGQGNITVKGVGEVTITVKTVDQLKESKCKIVIKPELVTSKDKYVVELNKDTTLDIAVKGMADATFVVEIQDENIAKYVDGKIQGIALGTTSAKIVCEKQDSVAKTIEIEVVEKIQEEIDVAIAENMKLTEGVLTGISPNTNIADILKNITTNGILKVLDKEGKEITEGVIGTGAKIVIELNGERIEYVIVVYGDVNGDGKTSPSDYVKVKNKILGTESVDGYFALAADANHDGKISPADYVKIKNCILGTENIEQLKKDE